MHGFIINRGRHYANEGILHPGVINTSAMCEVGGGALKKCVTAPFIALHKCHYSQIRRGERPRVVKQ